MCWDELEQGLGVEEQDSPCVGTFFIAEQDGGRCSCEASCDDVEGREPASNVGDDSTSIVPESSAIVALLADLTVVDSSRGRTKTVDGVSVC